MKTSSPLMALADHAPRATCSTESIHTASAPGRRGAQLVLAHGLNEFAARAPEDVDDVARGVALPLELPALRALPHAPHLGGRGALWCLLVLPVAPLLPLVHPAVLLHAPGDTSS